MTPAVLRSRLGLERGSPVEKRRADVGPASIYYQVTGSGPPIVLVHGLSGSGRWWARNVGGLARRFQVYVVDLIGFGRSGGRHPFVLDEAAGYLLEWLDQLAIPRVSLIGHSMGGLITTELAATRPDRVDRLVLVGAPLLPLSGYVRRVPGLVRALRHAPINFLAVLAMDALRAGPQTLASATRQLLTPRAQPDPASVAVPTLLVWGEKDTLVPPVVGEALHQSLPNAQFVVLDGTGHVPMWERPEAFNRIVLQFLESSGDERRAVA